ncbi:MAG: hypothetical protein Q7J24_06315 [Desulfomicrobium sp.]|nr:hypothetical protein [Desulfomicrobium sp.]
MSVQCPTNHEFLEAIYKNQLPDGARVVVASFLGNPNSGPPSKWHGEPWAPDATAPMPTTANNYFCVSSHYADEHGKFRRRKGNLAAVHHVVLDDVGTKIDVARVTLPPSWMLETSPGNFQVGYILTEPIKDAAHADRFMKAVIDAGLCDPGAGGPAARLCRLPNAVNGKTDPAFECRLDQWEPARRYTVAEFANHYGLELPNARRPKRGDGMRQQGFADEVFTPAPDENPVIAEAKRRGLYKASLGSGRHDITCPWVSDHTNQVDHGTAYFEPNEFFPLGGFSCLHSHGDKLTIKDLLAFLDITPTAAKCKPIIRVQAGDMHRVVDSGEMLLAKSGRYYQSGGIICQIVTDPATAETSIVQTPQTALVRALSQEAEWQRYDRRSETMVVTDPPDKVAMILHGETNYAHLPVLRGIARQPHLRPDGSLVSAPGYDPRTGRFGVFDSSKYNIPDRPTQKQARAALADLQDIVSEVAFDEDVDRSSGLCAMLTAAARPSLATAPGFLVSAHQISSGKSHYARLVSTLATPQQVAGLAFPDAEEMRKLLIATLLKSPAVVFFDDMTTDIVPSDALKTALTEEHVAGRILGVSKDVTVSTRSLFLFTGNNVEPVRDMSRRVLTINLDPRMEMPVAREFKRPDLIEQVRQDRGRYVSAALTIIRAWICAGGPVTPVKPIATFMQWANWCRQPLMWLGLPDPATRLFEQVARDPDSELLGRLMESWRESFDSRPVLVRDLIPEMRNNIDLRESIEEIATIKGEVDKNRLGWWIKRHQGRIVNGLRIEREDATRGAARWRVQGSQGFTRPCVETVTIPDRVTI